MKMKDELVEETSISFGDWVIVMFCVYMKNVTV